VSGHVEVLARTLYVQKINGYIHVQCLRLVGNVELCRSNTFCTDTSTAIYREKNNKYEKVCIIRSTFPRRYSRRYGASSLCTNFSRQFKAEV